MRIGANVRVQQIRFAVFNDSVSIFEIGFAFANGLDFRASERDPGFEFVQQKVVVSCGAVYRSISLTGGDWLSRLRFLSRWMSGLIQLPGHTFGYESSC